MSHVKTANFDPVADSVRSIPYFKKCSKQFIEQLAQKSNTLTLRKGQTLFVAEEKADQFYLVLDGWIKIYRETLDGTQAVTDIINNGHIFGDIALHHKNTYPYSAEAAEPSVVVALSLKSLKNEIERNPEFAVDLLSRMVASNETKDRELEHRTLQNAPQRVGCFILRLTNVNHQGPVTIHLPYDKTLIAARLGMQPETFSRAIKKLQEQTGIKIQGATVKMDNLQQLSNYVCSACTTEFPCKDLTRSKCENLPV